MSDNSEYQFDLKIAVLADAVNELISREDPILAAEALTLVLVGGISRGGATKEEFLRDMWRAWDFYNYAKNVVDGDGS